VRTVIVNSIAKFFVHGSLYSVFFLVWPLGWIPAIMFSFLVEGILGWAIGVGLLIFVLGFSNSTIVIYLWSTGELSLWRILFQGSVLLVVLAILNAIFISVHLWIPRLIFTLPWGLFQVVEPAAIFIIESLLLGLVGRKVAQWQIKKS